MDLVIHVYLKDFHDTAAPQSMKIYPLVDLKSLALNIQLTSLYLSSVTG